MAPLEPPMNNKENGLNMRCQVVKKEQKLWNGAADYFSDWMEKETFINPVAANHDNVSHYSIKESIILPPKEGLLEVSWTKQQSQFPPPQACCLNCSTVASFRWETLKNVKILLIQFHRGHLARRKSLQLIGSWLVNRTCTFAECVNEIRHE